MRLFIFAIGGTGSRVLKSLIMLSAAGVKPLDCDGRPMNNVEIVPVIIDPHKRNEDLKRTEQMLSAYRIIREKLYGNDVNGDGFFGMKISTLRSIMGMTGTTITDTFVFNMEAVGQTKFRQFIHYDTMNEPNQALTSLLFADYQLENKMNIGFVGSPNIGSVALNMIKDSEEFKAFANVFAEGDRIFFISSIFGGTGAAGFPILVKNIRQAQNLDVSNKNFLRMAPIGGLTVLPYFNLNNSQDKRIDKADFVVKTQSALQYYNETLTHPNERYVNALFYLGDQTSSIPYDYDPGNVRDQHNPAHLVELVGAMAALKFAGMDNREFFDGMGGFLPTKAFEYGLDRDLLDVSFDTFGQETRQLIYRPMVKFHMLFIYMRTALKAIIGQGFTQDEPKIRSEFTTTQFFRTLVDQFFDFYTEWLSEMHANLRHVQLFNVGENNLSNIIHNVVTKKGFFGRKNVDANTFNAELNKLSRDNKKYSDRTVEYKLLDLFNEAAGNILDDKYENIN